MASDPTGTRLVAVSQQQRDDWLTLAELMDEEGFNPEMTARLMQTLRAWDAAPADPAEALRQALAGWISGDPKVDLTDFSDDLDEVVTGVLAALGCVVERPANTGDHQ